MTQPPIDPAVPDRLADVSPTEPVPVVTPPAGAPAFTAPPAFAFIPVEPEPGPGLPAAPVASAGPATRNGGSSRILNVALGAAVLVGAVGIAFAAGRASAPTVTTSNTASVPVDGGTLPGASFDLDGEGNGRPGAPGDGDDGDGDRGFGRGLRGIELTGTVTAVTTDSISIQTDAGPVITFSLDGTTTYHQESDATASDVRTGTRVQVTPSSRVQPTRGADGEINLGTAGDITIIP